MFNTLFNTSSNPLFVFTYSKVAYSLSKSNNKALAKKLQKPDQTSSLTLTRDLVRPYPAKIVDPVTCDLKPSSNTVVLVNITAPGNCAVCHAPRQPCSGIFLPLLSLHVANGHAIVAKSRQLSGACSPLYPSPQCVCVCVLCACVRACVCVCVHVFMCACLQGDDDNNEVVPAHQLMIVVNEAVENFILEEAKSA